MAPAIIEVRIWGKRAGAVAFDQNLGCYVFEYAPAWRKRGIELAPLLMPVSAASTSFAFPGLSRDSFNGLPGLLADALPDDFGNALIDAWMSQRGIDKNAVTTLDRLAYMGKRGMGAMEFRPAKGSHTESSAPLQMKELVETARKVINADISTDDVAQAALANIIRVGTSAGGARAKAVVAWNPTTEEIRSGQFDVDPGFEHWLIKFDDVGKDLELGSSQGYGRIEYAYHLMALAAGIDMSPCRLLIESGRAHFMTKRFDRHDNQKHHIQTLCAMQHMDYKQRATHAYESLFITAGRLQLSDSENQQLFLRMAFNVVARNCDDHTKNFAFMLQQDKPWQLAPAYDITYAHNPKGEWTYQHLMSINGKFDGALREDLLAVADRFSVPAAPALIDQVNQAVKRWREFTDLAGLSGEDVSRISQNHRLL
ncbi:MAG: type II toxin-antitoxin system HipA family toxin [Thermomonas sp.]